MSSVFEILELCSPWPCSWKRTLFRGVLGCLGQKRWLKFQLGRQTSITSFLFRTTANQPKFSLVGTKKNFQEMDQKLVEDGTGVGSDPSWLHQAYINQLLTVYFVVLDRFFSCPE